MRKVHAIAAASALAIVATGATITLRASPETMTADVERDLNLAARVPENRSGVVSSLEQGTGPSGNERGVKLAVPTKKRAPSPAKSEKRAEVAAGQAQSDPASPATSTVAPEIATASTTETSAAPSDQTQQPELAPAVGRKVSSGIAVASGAGGPSAADDDGLVNGERPIFVTDVHGTGINRRGGVGAIMRGASPPRDHCEPVQTRRPSEGTQGTALGGLNTGILSGADRASGAGTAVGGPMAGGTRRW